MAEPLWVPSERQKADANITAFMRRVAETYRIAVPDYATLWQWSVDRPEQFWSALWDFVPIIGDKGAAPYVENPASMIDAVFFPRARLNVAENLLRRRDDAPAVIFWREDGFKRTVSHRELYDQVSIVRQALIGCGVVEGDRVGAVMPTAPETLVCMLAASSIGAIWSSCSPDFGVQGVIDRLSQIDPKILFGVDGYSYNGKVHDVHARLKDIAAKLPTLERIVLVPYVSLGGTGALDAKTVHFEDFVRPYRARAIEFPRFPFDQPAFVLYTSGTTGVPKSILHGAGRALIKLLCEHVLHFDLKPGDRFYYFTTTGWNVWYLLTAALGAGGVVLMYDGSPFHPKSDAIFDMADAENMAVLGTSPKYLEAIRKFGLTPIKTHHLTSLRTILTTGAPLSADGFDYVYDSIKRDVRLSSISGGTEMVSTLANGNPIGPVWRGDLQVRALGMKAEVYDEAGQSVRGEKGELVVTAPFPSRPLRFWNDPGDARYHETYFSRFANVWHHGDYAEITARDGMIIYGRSDATLNPGGVRIGTAEIYRAVEELDEVVDSIVVGQDWQGDVRVVLFVKLREGLTLSDGLTETIKRRVRDHATARHVPAKVIQVVDIPYTINGKKVELAVRNLIHGRPVKNVGSLANPKALDHFRDRTELRSA